MNEREWLTKQFEENRPHLQAVAQRMLGSPMEADDAVQEAWLRLNSADASGIRNLSRWLTTVVARVCLDMLRSRKSRRELALEDRVGGGIVSHEDALDPEQEVLLADSVGLALLVVLERLTPAERVAFVLHDMFDLPFVDIADIVGRSPAAARQLASRARRRVNEAALPRPDPDLARQRQVVAAFYAAARKADFDGLLQGLDPDVVLRTEFGAARGPSVVRGAPAVAEQARVPRGGTLRPILVNGLIG